MRFNIKDYLVKPDTELSLKNYNPSNKKNVPETKELRQAYVAKHSPVLGELQEKLYAENKRKFLVVLQGMDTGGKDGTIRHVFQSVNPIGIRVHAFKAPTELELGHDFLWRIHQKVPAKGQMVIFNRSHYEDVLIQKVRGWIDDKEEKRRLESIRQFEKHLADSGTTIVKFFLHISKEEQRERLQERLDRKEKNWKFNPGDLEDRALWDEYQRQYERVLSKTSTSSAPWFIVPGNSKSTRNCVVMNILLNQLKGMDIKYPKVDSSDWPKTIL